MRDSKNHRPALLCVLCLLLFGAALSARTQSVGITDPARILNPASVPLQSAGATFLDPVFGSTLRRVTSASDSGSFATHVYSQLQAFSSDNFYLLLIERDGYAVRRINDLSKVEGLDTSGWNAPRWHPTLAHKIVHFDSNEDTTLRVQLTDIDTRTTSTLFTFPSRYERIFGNQSFDDLSEDGRWIAGMARRNDGERIIFALDLEKGALGAELPLSFLYSSQCPPDPQWGQVEPDWVGISPLGRYLVVQWKRDGTQRCSGLETLDLRTGAFIGRVYDGHQHGDMGVETDGATEFFMTFELYHPSGRASIGVRRFPGTASVSPPVYVQLIDWGNGEHISCRGPRGECLVTAGSDPANGWGPFEAELFLQRTDGTVLRLAHHRSTSCGYWVQPRASISRDGRYVIFASDWGRETGRIGCGGGQELGRGDAYLIDLRNERTNTPPVAAPDSYSVSEGATLTVNAPGVLANDTDSDSDSLTARLISGPSRGSLTLNADGSFSYRPDSGFTGADSFTYTANDNSAQSNAATATIMVSSFDVCLQDDTSGDVLLISSTAGDYRFTACGAGSTLSGTGRVKVKKKGCVISLKDTRSDRDVRATFNNCKSKGSASVTWQGRTFQIADSATTNNACACR